MSSLASDQLGLGLTGADAISAAHYGRALHELQCFVGDPVASVDAAIAAAPTSSWRMS